MSRHVNIPCWQHALMNRISNVSGHTRVGWVTMEHFWWGGAQAWGERTCTPPSLFFFWRLQTIFMTDVPNFMRLNFSWFPGLKGQPINCNLHFQFWIRLFESPLKFCPRSVFFLHFFPAFSFKLYLWRTYQISWGLIFRDFRDWKDRPLIAKRASDVMTQTKLRQTQGDKQTEMVDDFEDFFKDKSRCS